MNFSKLILMCLESSSFFAQDIMQINVIHEKSCRKRKFQDYKQKYKELRQNPEEFFEFTGISMETFDYVLRKTKPVLQQTSAIVDATLKILLTLRYLSTGESVRSLAETFHIGITTVSHWIYQTFKAMLRALKRHIAAPTTQQFTDISRSFYHKYEFPNCIGAVGVKLIRIKKSRVHGKKCFKNRKKFFVTLQAVADNNFKFLTVEVNGLGRTFNGTKLCKSIENNLFNIPKSQRLANADIIIPHVLVGGEDMPLKPYLMRPFPQKTSDVSKHVYNNKILETKQCIDIAFQLLMTKFKIFDRPIESNTKHRELLIKTACLLHNIVREKDGRRDLHYRMVVGKDMVNKKFEIYKNKSNNSCSLRATKIRYKFVDYFNK